MRQMTGVNFFEVDEDRSEHVGVMQREENQEPKKRDNVVPSDALVEQRRMSVMLRRAGGAHETVHCVGVDDVVTPPAEEQSLASRDVAVPPRSGKQNRHGRHCVQQRCQLETKEQLVGPELDVDAFP